LWALLLWPNAGQGALASAAALTILATCGAHRLRRALWLNHRYRFTTWRWGKLMAALVFYGLLLRMFLSA